MWKKFVSCNFLFKRTELLLLHFNNPSCYRIVWDNSQPHLFTWNTHASYYISGCTVEYLIVHLHYQLTLNCAAIEFTNCPRKFILQLSCLKVYLNQKMRILPWFLTVFCPFCLKKLFKVYNRRKSWRTFNPTPSFAQEKVICLRQHIDKTYFRPLSYNYQPSLLF